MNWRQRYCFLASTLVHVVHGKDMTDYHAEYAVVNSIRKAYSRRNLMLVTGLLDAVSYTFPSSCTLCLP
jgi:hypothetical protein